MARSFFAGVESRDSGSGGRDKHGLKGFNRGGLLEGTGSKEAGDALLVLLGGRGELGRFRRIGLAIPKAACLTRVKVIGAGSDWFCGIVRRFEHEFHLAHV